MRRHRLVPLNFFLLCLFLFPSLLSQSSIFFGAVEAVGAVNGGEPAELLDNFSCVNSSSLSSGLPYGGRSESPVGDRNGRFSTPSWHEIPCLERSQVSLTTNHNIRPGDVLLLLDIDDTLISTGDWSAVMGKSLGGTDGRYPRGSEYPGLGAALYLLALGPHTYDAHTKALINYSYPLNVMMVTARPNMTLFRPPHLIPHLNFLLTRGVQQVQGLQVSSARKTLWAVGSENIVNPVQLIKGTAGRGEAKLGFLMKAINERLPIGTSHISASTKFIFFGDTGEKDLEVGIGLAAVAPHALAAMFTHVVHKHTDPRSHQSSAANKDERSRRGVEEEGELLNTASSFLQSVLTGAASAASAAGKLIGGTRGRDFMPPSERNSYLSGRDEMLRDYQGGEFSRSSSGSAGIINRSTGSDVQGPGYHRDREEDNGAAPNNGARKITETLGNTARFAIRVPSDVLVDAVSLTYDVTVSSEDEEGPRRCEDLSPSQAFEVGMAVGEKVRRIFDMYEKRWRHSLRDFHLENPTGSSSVPENRRLPPLVFVRCKSVKLRISGDARPSSPLQVWWSSIASRATGRQSSTRGSVTVRFEKVPVQTSLGPKAYQELGTPIAPYTTSLSAIGQAYALGLADANDIEVVMKRTHQALRSQGPLAQPARVPALVDHQYDLDALMFLLFPKASKQMPPFSITTPMNAMAEAFEQRSVAQMAFLKRAAYSRSYPERALACVAGLERSAEAYYSQLTTPREGIETSTNSERPPFSHSDLRSFALAFAPFICDLDVELATVRFAAEAELQGLAVYFARAIREALAAAEEQGLRLGVVTGLINDKENGTQSLGTSAGSVSNLTPTACALDPYSAKQFRSMYQVLCSRVSPTLCQLFNARLLKNGLLEDMLLMAKERGQGNIDPIRLPRTGIVIFGDGTAPEIFEEKHQQPTKDLLGSMGERLDKVLKEQAGGSFYFPKWPVVESPSRWRNIAHTLELAIGCRLLVAS